MMLPGYDYSARYSGFSPDFDAPGAFLLKHQNTDIWGNRTSDFALYAATRDGLFNNLI